MSGPTGVDYRRKWPINYRTGARSNPAMICRTLQLANIAGLVAGAAWALVLGGACGSWARVRCSQIKRIQSARPAVNSQRDDIGVVVIIVGWVQEESVTRAA